jgi:hypothetical protein
MDIKKILTIKNFVILFLLTGMIVVSFMLKNQKPTIVEKEVLKIKDSVQVDSVPYPEPFEVYLEGETKFVDTTIYVPQTVDTSKILSTYYNKSVIKDTLKLKDIGMIILTDTIVNNKLVSRVWTTPKIKSKIVRDTIRIAEEKEKQIFFGVDGSVNNQDMINGVGLGVLYKTKDDKIFHLGAGVSNRATTGMNYEFFPYLSGGVYWRMGNKKRQ